jgi:plastocyanin
MMSASLVAGALLFDAGSALALGDVTSVSIVDAPRPQLKWGYAPVTRKIQPGTWVSWSNDGEEEHTVTADDGSFDSGDLDPSEGFSWFFDQPGTFTYVCSLHTWMTGKIVVTSSQPSAISDQPVAGSDPPEANAPEDSTDVSPANDAVPPLAN